MEVAWVEVAWVGAALRCLPIDAMEDVMDDEEYEIIDSLLCCRITGDCMTVEVRAPTTLPPRRWLHQISLVLLLLGSPLVSQPTHAATLTPCFTPGEDCTGLIVDQIEQAKLTLLVQAYGFTSPSIIQALARAKDRGVNVRVILDKSNEQPRYTGATYLTNHGIPVLIDDRVAIAHNKVLVIDGKHVITGSFNFTRAAQSRNAENVLVVTDAAELASSYTRNFNRRTAASRPLRPTRDR